MHQLITKIGKGQRGAKDLSWDEAKQAARDMIEGNATPYQTGAFLMAMRIKLEGVTELASFTAATRSYVAPIDAPAGLNVVDVPVYAEKHNTHHVCLPAAIVAASAGASILLHGIDNPTVSSDLPRVLAQLGIPVALQGDDLAAMLQRDGFAYLDLALYHPPLAKLLALREQLGAQNLFHQVARLLNPMRAHSQVVGVAHPPYLEKIPEVVNMIGGRRLLVFQGMEGFPELSIAAPTSMRELRDNRVTRLTLKPEDVRLPPGSFQHMAVAPQLLQQGSGPTSSPSVHPERSVSEVEGRQGSGPTSSPSVHPERSVSEVEGRQDSGPTPSPSVRPERNVSEVEGRQGSGQAPNDVPVREAEMIQRVLQNQVRDRFRDWVVYNAAMLLYAAGRAHSIAEGVPLAQRSLESGAAAQKLADLASTMDPPSPQPFDKAQDRPSPSGGEGVEQPKVVHA